MTAPTLTDVDGFAHQTLSIAQSASGFIGVYDNVGNGGTLPNNGGGGITFDTTNKRLTHHVASIKIVQDGVTSTSVRRTIAVNTLVVSFYFRVATAPVATSKIFNTRGPTNVPSFQMNTSGGVRVAIGGTASSATSSLADSAWHRADLYFDTSATTYTIKWAVDGVAQTDLTVASQTIANMTSSEIGSSNAGDNLTFWMQDFVASTTLGDHPIGPHVVLPVYPSGDGTSTLGTTNPIVNEVGTATTPSTRVDEWNGGTANTSDYVTYTNTATGDAASNFAEFTVSDPVATFTTIWDVEGIIAGFAAGTNANNADTQVLTGHGGTLIDHIGSGIDYSGSTTVLGYYRQKLARPSGGWSNSVLTGVVVQWGRSSDTNPLPRLSAVMLEYAAPPGTSTVTHTTDAIVLKTSSVSATTDADVKKTLSVSASTDAIVKKTASVSASTDAIVRATLAVAASTDADVKATLAVSASTGAVILKAATVACSTDALLRATLAASATTDAEVLATLSVSASTDTAVLKAATATHSTDALIRATLSASAATDAEILATLSVSASTDAIVRKTLATSASTDSVLLKTASTSHSTDAIVQATSSAVYATDAVALVTAAASQQADAILRATLSATQQVDADVRATLTAAQDVDAILRATLAVAHDTDAVALKTTAVSASTDAVLRATLTASHSTDAVIDSGASTSSVSNSTDAIVRKTTAVSQSADAEIEKQLTGFHRADAVVLKSITAAHDTDAQVVLRSAVAYATDALLRATIVAPHESDAAILRVATRVHATSAFISSTVTTTHVLDTATDAVIFNPFMSWIEAFETLGWIAYPTQPDWQPFAQAKWLAGELLRRWNETIQTAWRGSRAGRWNTKPQGNWSRGATPGWA